MLKIMKNGFNMKESGMQKFIKDDTNKTYKNEDSLFLNKVIRVEEDIKIIEKKSLTAIKISVAAMGISLLLGLFALWVLLNQVTISVGMDKKIVEIKKEIEVLKHK